MKIEKHNPYYKLVSAHIDDGQKHIELVYGISNEGKNEGMEAYYYRDNEIGHYRSYRWLDGNIPQKFNEWYIALRENVKHCPNGHKLEIN